MGKKWGRSGEGVGEGWKGRMATHRVTVRQRQVAPGGVVREIRVEEVRRCRARAERCGDDGGLGRLLDSVGEE